METVITTIAIVLVWILMVISNHEYPDMKVPIEDLVILLAIILFMTFARSIGWPIEWPEALLAALAFVHPIVTLGKLLDGRYRIERG